MNNDSNSKNRSTPRLEVGQRKGRAKRAIRRAKRIASRTIIALSKRSERFRLLSRAALDEWRKAKYRTHVRGAEIDDKVIFFESFQARSYSCNPKALYKAIVADPRFDDYKLVWAFRSPRAYAEVAELGRATIVSFGSPIYNDYHARAKYWIQNAIIPIHLTPRDGQVYVQTWHGTPLKRLGCDIREESSGNVLFSADEIHKRYLREGARLTYLLSPSAFATEKLGSAFGLATLGKTSAIIEEGYPRNDFLATFDQSDVADVKGRLGIPAGKKVILYAPTFRDNQHSSATGYKLDLGLDFGKLHDDLGDDYVVLFRAHYLVARTFDFASHEGFIYDVSDVDDINELYIASDVLVTDYSAPCSEGDVTGVRPGRAA
jgi:CDP-glycerol glycerophosphotransferase